MVSNIVWSPTARSLTFTYTNGLPRVVTTSGTGLPTLTVTNFWDGLNRLTGTAFPDGTTTSNLYDRLYLGAAKDRLGYWTSYGYDALEHLISITDARSNVTHVGLVRLRRALQHHRPADQRHQPVLQQPGAANHYYEFADNSSVTYTLDSIGRVTSVADGLGKALELRLQQPGPGHHGQQRLRPAGVASSMMPPTAPSRSPTPTTSPSPTSLTCSTA